MTHIKCVKEANNKCASIENIAKEMRKKYFGGDTEILRTEMGKPYFKDGKAHMSGSHSKDFTAVAVSDIEVGLDIEKVREKRFIEIAKYAFNAKEAGCLIASKNIAKDFFILWTLKEAYIKLHGRSVTSIKNTPFVDIENKKFDCESDFAVLTISDFYILSVIAYGEIKIESECVFKTLFKSDNVIII